MKTIFTISNTTKSSLSDSTNQKKEKSISCVAFGLSLASSSSESQINVRMKSLESSPSESMASLSYLSFSRSSVSLLSAILCQCPGISQSLLASDERTRLLQAMPHNYLDFLTLVALQMLL